MQALVDVWNDFVLMFEEYFLSIIKEITFVDILDILILALVFYYIYCFIRDRRAGKLALGLLLIMALFVLSSVRT